MPELLLEENFDVWVKVMRAWIDDSNVAFLVRRGDEKTVVYWGRNNTPLYSDKEAFMSDLLDLYTQRMAFFWNGKILEIDLTTYDF